MWLHWYIIKATEASKSATCIPVKCSSCLNPLSIHNSPVREVESVSFYILILTKQKSVWVQGEIKRLVKRKASAVVLQMNDVPFDGKYNTACSIAPPLSSQTLKHVLSLPLLRNVHLFPRTVRGPWNWWVSIHADEPWVLLVHCASEDPVFLFGYDGSDWPAGDTSTNSSSLKDTDKVVMLRVGNVSSLQHLQKNPGQAARGVCCGCKWLPHGCDQVAGWRKREESECFCELIPAVTK